MSEKIEFNVLPSGHRWYPRPADIGEWRAGRKDYLGASEVAAIMGVNPNQTAYDVWLSKTGRTGPGEDNLRLFMGRHMEPGIAEWYALETGRILKDDKRVWVHPHLDYLRCNLDRVATPVVGEAEVYGDGIVECKSVGLMAKNKWVHGYPEQYFVQIQTQLLLTPYKWADLAAVVGGNVDYLTFRIFPNPTVQDLILKEIQRFWRYVETDTEPPLVAVDLSKVQAEAGSVLEATPSMLLDHQLLLSIRRELKALESRQEEVADRIKEGMQKFEILTHLGMPIVAYKNYAGRKQIDGKRLEKEMPDVYKKYVTSTKPYRKFEPKEVEFHVQPSESGDGQSGTDAKH